MVFSCPNSHRKGAIPITTTDAIIDHCLKGIGEDTTAPVEMEREEVLTLINQLYQNDIGKRLKSLAVYSYDASDAAHTITAGVGTLPTDFLSPAQVYDGDAPTNNPLTQIFKIEDKVASISATTQFMLPDNANLWIFGSTPANTIKLYYYSKPAALTDSNSSSPTALREEFHIDIFVARVKEVYAMRQNNTYDMMDMRALIVDYLAQISDAHTTEKGDDTPARIIIDEYGGCG